MCGIWALFGYDHSTSSELHQALLIAHRGPDFFRIESLPGFKHCSLAFHRLSIMDGLCGQQPFRTFDYPHLHLLYNGEIYNFKALGKKFGFNFTSKMDGEVILHLYHQFGAKKTADLLDGVFAFCIVDTEKGEVHLGRDTFGVRPMFIIEPDSGELGISSEAKALVALAGDNGRTQQVWPFSPGSYKSYKLDKVNGKVKLFDQGKYSTVDSKAVFDVPVEITDNVQKNIRELLTDAVRKRLMSERRIGCLLSGGLDSSLIASLVVKLAKEADFQYKIQTFSIGMEGSPDLAAARKVADQLNTEHHEVVFTPNEAFDVMEALVYSLESYDITTIRASLPMYLLARYIRENTETVVIFSGEGADELAQGYIYFHKAPTAEKADAESKRLLEDIYLYDGLRADRSTAAHGLELRVPILDKAFTSYFLSLPAEMRQPQKGIEKHLLRSSFDGHLKGLLPDEVLWRAKEAFSDGVSTSTKPWYIMLQEYCASKMNDEAFNNAAKLFPMNTPKTKEATYYRVLFNKSFPGQSHMIPYFWMPKWIEGASDPSARTLTHYKQ